MLLLFSSRFFDGFFERYIFICGSVRHFMDSRYFKDVPCAIMFA